MPLFLLAQWRWLLPLAIAAGLGVALLITRAELSSLRAANAKALALATEAAREQEAKNAVLAQEIEKAHVERSQAIDEAYNANTELARTRGLRVRGVKCLPQTTPDSSHSADGTSEIRLPDEVSGFLLSFARECDRAAEYAQSCHDWAMKVGQ